LPELDFNFYDFKVEFTNSKDKKAVVEDLLTNKWNDEKQSIWYLEYEKYDASEGAKLHYVNNLLGGFLQRMEGLNQHTFAVFGVYGDEPNLNQKAVALWRGKDIPVPMNLHPQFEYWKKRKLNPKDKKDKKLIIDYLTTKEGKVEGHKVQNFKMFK